MSDCRRSSSNGRLRLRSTTGTTSNGTVWFLGAIIPPELHLKKKLKSVAIHIRYPLHITVHQSSNIHVLQERTYNANL